MEYRKRIEAQRNLETDCSEQLKLEMKQSVKFTCSKLISTVIKKYITNTINVNIFKDKIMFCYSFWSKGAAILRCHSV